MSSAISALITAITCPPRRDANVCGAPGGTEHEPAGSNRRPHTVDDNLQVTLDTDERFLPGVVDVHGRLIAVVRIEVPVLDHEVGWHAPIPQRKGPATPYTVRDIVEVAGFEPACSGDRLGLLRAQPVISSRPSASTGGGPRGQSGCDVPHQPPDGTGGVSLLR
jgi:hypothetical protein